MKGGKETGSELEVEAKRVVAQRPLGGCQADRSQFSSTKGLTCGHCLIIGLLEVVLGFEGVVSRCACGLRAPTNLADGLTLVYTYRKTVVIRT